MNSSGSHGLAVDVLENLSNLAAISLLFNQRWVEAKNHLVALVGLVAVHPVNPLVIIL